MIEIEDVFNAIKEIINAKNENNIYPLIASVEEVVERTGLYMYEVNCDIGKLIENRRVRSVMIERIWGFELL